MVAAAPSAAMNCFCHTSSYSRLLEVYFEYGLRAIRPHLSNPSVVVVDWDTAEVFVMWIVMEEESNPVVVVVVVVVAKLVVKKVAVGEARKADVHLVAVVMVEVDAVVVVRVVRVVVVDCAMEAV
tara:strand:- start:161 stop:535 length:375 start_codon:yes stop_codon:yes gene_type:complete